MYEQKLPIGRTQLPLDALAFVWVLLSQRALYKGYSVGASCEGIMHSFDHVRTRVCIEIIQSSNYLFLLKTLIVSTHNLCFRAKIRK